MNNRPAVQMLYAQRMGILRHIRHAVTHPAQRKTRSQKGIRCRGRSRHLLKPGSCPHHHDRGGDPHRPPPRNLSRGETTNHPARPQTRHNRPTRREGNGEAIGRIRQSKQILQLGIARDNIGEKHPVREEKRADRQTRGASTTLLHLHRIHLSSPSRSSSRWMIRPQPSDTPWFGGKSHPHTAPSPRRMLRLVTPHWPLVLPKPWRRTLS